MRLKSLTFEDKRTGWRLEDLRLDPFNLLVGASGVGKTKILRALRESIRQSNRARGNLECSFELRFEHEGQGYAWQFESVMSPSIAESSATPDERGSHVLNERLSLDGEAEPIIDRAKDRFLFKNKSLATLSVSIQTWVVPMTFHA